MAHVIKPTGKKSKKSEATPVVARQPKKGPKVRMHHGDHGVPDYKASKKPVVRQPDNKATPKVNYDGVALADLRPPTFTLKVIHRGNDSVTVECTCVATGGRTVRTVRMNRVSLDILILAYAKA